MKFKPSALLTATAAAISVAALSGSAFAHDGSSSLAAKIASKFNLNQSEVQKVIDEERFSQRANHEKRYEDKLNRAVEKGKLTEEQKTKILAKHKEVMTEIESKRQSLKDNLNGKTGTERRDAIKQFRTEMDDLMKSVQQWEKDNNIPSGYVMGRSGYHRGGFGHMHGKFGQAMPDDNSSDQSHPSENTTN